jgi:hypothetical protein
MFIIFDLVLLLLYTKFISDIFSSKVISGYLILTNCVELFNEFLDGFVCLDFLFLYLSATQFIAYTNTIIPSPFSSPDLLKEDFTLWENIILRLSKLL